MKKIKFLFLVIVVCILFGGVDYGLAEDTKVEVIKESFFRHQKIENINITMPTVVELTIPGGAMYGDEYMVFDETAELMQPYYYKVKSDDLPASMRVGTFPDSDASKMIDRDHSTYAEFISEEENSSIELIIHNTQPVTITEITLLVGSNKVSSEAKEQVISVSRASSNEWHFILDYKKYLRIYNIEMIDREPDTHVVRWLAQPDHEYTVYSNANAETTTLVSDSAKLYSDENVFLLPHSPNPANPSYKKKDTDSDGVIDAFDNCRLVSNSDQGDENFNQIGDVCEDVDEDGVLDYQDNCPYLANNNQMDKNNNGMGDACEKFAEGTVTGIGTKNKVDDISEKQVIKNSNNIDKVAQVDEIDELNDNNKLNISVKDKMIEIGKHPRLPLIGIGFAVAVIIILFVITALSGSSQADVKQSSVSNNKVIYIIIPASILLIILAGIFLKKINNEDAAFQWFQEGTYFEYDFYSKKESKTYPSVMTMRIIKSGYDRDGFLRTSTSFNAPIHEAVEFRDGRVYSTKGPYSLSGIDKMILTKKRDGIYDVYSDSGFGMIKSRYYAMKLPIAPNSGDSGPVYIFPDVVNYHYKIIETNKKINVPAGEFEVYVVDNGRSTEYWSNKYGLIKFEVFDDSGKSIGIYSLSKVGIK